MSTPKHRIAFASDFHLGHNRDFIYKARGFETIRGHDQWILQSLAEIGADDHLYYLGDFALNTTPDQVREFFRRIRCDNIFYIWGNHESSTSKIYNEVVRSALIPEMEGEFEVYPITVKNVTFLGHVHQATINQQRIVMQHYAPLIWDKSHRGSWALCGHSHGSCKEILPQATHGKRLDVGVDVAMKYQGRPFFWFEDIVTIMNRKELAVVDRHGSEADEEIYDYSSLQSKWH